MTAVGDVIVGPTNELLFFVAVFAQPRSTTRRCTCGSSPGVRFRRCVHDQMASMHAETVVGSVLARARPRPLRFLPGTDKHCELAMQLSLFVQGSSVRIRPLVCSSSDSSSAVSAITGTSTALLSSGSSRASLELGLVGATAALVSEGILCSLPLSSAVRSTVFTESALPLAAAPVSASSVNNRVDNEHGIGANLRRRCDAIAS